MKPPPFVVDALFTRSARWLVCTGARQKYAPMSLLTRDMLVEKIATCTTLPSVPEAAKQVLALTRSDDAVLAEVAKFVAQDTVLSARVVGAANAPFYGLSSKADTVPQAVTLLGTHAVKAHVCADALKRSIESVGPANAPWLMQYWRRAVYSATAAREFAGHVAPERADECLIAALLMDVGMLVLEQVIGPLYPYVLQTAASHQTAHELESRFFVITHADASKILAGQWRLPDHLAIALSAHHDLQAIEDGGDKQMAQLIWLAGRCADIFVEKQATADGITGIYEDCDKLYGINQSICESMLRTIGERAVELATVFDVAIDATPAEHDRIVARANLQSQPGDGADRPGSDFVEQRRAPRIRRDGRINIVLCARTPPVGGQSPPPTVQVTMRDVSATGIGFTHVHPMEPGAQFRIELPHQNGQVKSFLYTVARCSAEPRGGYIIGARLANRTDLPAQEQQPSQQPHPQGDAEAA